ncbi:MAG: sulfotransferase, partial [Gammaproteobacteria bacterium]
MTFPKAHIIYCRRNPLDTCVSIYFHNFKFVRFAWDLYDIGHQYAQHARLMAHWMKVLPGRIFT